MKLKMGCKKISTKSTLSLVFEIRKKRRQASAMTEQVRTQATKLDEMSSFL